MMEERVYSVNHGSGTTSIASVPLEVWMMIAEQIRNRKTLQAFASTCHAFHEFCQPLLYTERELHLHLLNIESDTNSKSLPPHLEHSKALRVLLHEFPRIKKHPLQTPDIPFKSSTKSQYTSFLARVLSQLENLESFEWHDHSFVDNYKSALILNNSRVLESLKRLPLLRNVMIQFSGAMLEDEEKALRCFIPLQGFRNLTSLELYQFYGEESFLIKHLTRALRESPNLKKLGLGLACDAKCTGNPETYILEHKGRFFEWLCLYYASEPNSRPLPLETLRLGNAVCLSKSNSEGAGNYLEKLVKVDGLHTLHLFNGFVTFLDESEDFDDDDDFALEIDCSLLENCKSLYQLSISRISPAIVQWLSGPARTVEELFVTDHYGMYDDELDLFNLLELNRLSMLYVSEFRVKTEDEWSDVDSSDSDTTDPEMPDLVDTSPETAHLRRDGRGSNSRVFEDLASITILDRVSRRNDLSYLKKLSFSFEFETQWTHFTEVLPLLKNLQQLHLRSKGGRFPPPQSSLWPGITHPKEIALQYAKAIHELCPSLRYIAIGDRPAWHIQYCNPAEGNETGLAFIPVLEEDLDFMEMFTYDVFAYQSALLVPDYNRERITLDEYELERMLASSKASKAKEEIEYGFPN